MGRIADAISGLAIPQQKQQKLLALDSEFVEMETQIQSLKTKVLHLETKVNPLEREVERLKNQVEGMQSKPTQHLDHTAEQALVIMANEGGQGTKGMLIRYLSLSATKADYYMDILTERGLIESTGGDPYSGPTYGATAAGRKYLVGKNLIS
jgi:hypothetical protein